MIEGAFVRIVATMLVTALVLIVPIACSMTMTVRA